MAYLSNKEEAELAKTMKCMEIDNSEMACNMSEQELASCMSGLEIGDNQPVYSIHSTHYSQKSDTMPGRRFMDTHIIKVKPVGIRVATIEDMLDLYEACKEDFGKEVIILIICCL